MNIGNISSLHYGTGTTASVPQGSWIDGQEIFALVYLELLGVPITAGAGFTQVGTQIEESTFSIALFKKFYHTELGNHVFSWDGSSRGRAAVVFQVPGANTTTPVNFVTQHASAAATTEAKATGGTPSSDGCLLVQLTANASGVHTSPPVGMTEREQFACFIGEQLLGAAGVATGDKIGTLAEAKRNASYLLAITPAAPEITKPGTQKWTVGIPINELVVSALNSTSCTITGLPTGVTGAGFDANGTPSAISTGTATITCKGPGGETSVTFPWEVISAATAGTWQGYTAFSPIPASTRIGSATAAFNRPVGQSRVLPSSAQMVTWLLGSAPVEANPLAVSYEGGGFPTVFAANSDPQVEIIDAATGFFNGKKVRIPVVAKCQPNGDHHLQVVLCPNDCVALGVPEGSTADFWQVNAAENSETIIYEGGGTKLKVSSSGLGNMTGSLVGGNAVAANYDLNAGIVRGPEFRAHAINHALVAVVYNVKKSFVRPATHTDGEANGLPTGLPAYAPAMGQRFRLNFTIAEIEALGLPPWLATVAKALSTYGFYIQDTGNAGMLFRIEDGNMYSAFGAQNMIEASAKQEGLSIGEHSQYAWVFGDPRLKWAERLQAIALPAEEGKEQPEITLPAEQSAKVGQTINLQIVGKNVESWELLNAPQGVKIDPVTGKVTGTFTKAETITATVIGKGAGTEVEVPLKFIVGTASGEEKRETGGGEGEAVSLGAAVPAAQTTIVDLARRVIEEGQFDVGEAMALRWLDERHKLMVARTKCYRRQIAIGPTVAGQAGYVVPPEIMEMREVQVGSSPATGSLGVPYGQGRHRDLAEGALHYIWLGGLYLAVGGGIYVRDENVSGEDVLSLFPTPTESGLPITVFAVCRPEPLSLTTPTFVVGNPATIRYCATTRGLTQAELESFVSTGVLPAGIGTAQGVSSVTFKYREAGVAWTTAAVVTDATGAYHSTVQLTAAGELEWEAQGLSGTGAVVWTAAGEEQVGTGQPLLKIPAESVSALVDGAIATGLNRMEGRPDLAANFEQIFSAACTELLRQQNQRFRSAGPAEIRVKGFNA